MLTSRATIGVVAINTQPACTNQGFITCLPNKNISAYHLYFWLLDRKEEIISLASGATFKEINKATFRRISMIVPSADVATLLAEELDPIGKQVQALQKKDANLRVTRDLLLPKLISGEVEVEGLEIDVGGDGG